MRKLIAIDLDGTLLSSKLEISKENIKAIQTAQNQGHVVMICSGRAPEDIRGVIENTSLECPVAGSNGTVVVADGKTLSEISLNKQDVASVANTLDEKKYPFKLYTSHGIFVPTTWSARLTQTFEQNQALADSLSPEEYKRMTEQPAETDSIKIFNQLEEVLKVDDLTIQKFFVPTIEIEKKDDLIASLKKYEGISITTSGPHNIEIMAINGHKGNGLKTMAEYYNIPIESTVAIGDNFNDVPMLEIAGLSVAMGNADPTVKELSDVVTLTNDEHGVAHAIEKFVLNS
ncbi:Cof-type HAD-IIB family hydrolase [Metabacillus herbersteinensis]|uniref:Cof-type HAD-IIB family hydrolase n=1 Tax=Metabacillus herbersteinensis TaxID=283816 RepID=A0ABV6GG50_9BACI